MVPEGVCTFFLKIQRSRNIMQFRNVHYKALKKRNVWPCLFWSLVLPSWIAKGRRYLRYFITLHYAYSKDITARPKRSEYVFWLDIDGREAHSGKL